MAPPGLTISIQVYLTGDSAFHERDDISVKFEKDKDEPQVINRAPSLLEDPAVQVTRGCRPNLKKILQEEADLTGGRMGVTGLSYYQRIIHVANHDINAQYVVPNLLQPL